MSKSALAFSAGSICDSTALIGTGGLGRRGEFGSADERPLGRAQIDEGEIAGGKRVAVRLVCVDTPHPYPQESSG